MVDKTLHRKLTIEQHEPHRKTGFVYIIARLCLHCCFVSELLCTRYSLQGQYGFHSFPVVD
jgi:hypothetical protein